MLVRAFLYDRSDSFVAACRRHGVTHDTDVDLTPEQIINLSKEIAVMLLPSQDGKPQTMALDSPRWRFKQR